MLRPGSASFSSSTDKVRPDPARVRLSAFGDSAFVLDVFAFAERAEMADTLPFPPEGDRKADRGLGGRRDPGLSDRGRERPRESLPPVSVLGCRRRDGPAAGLDELGPREDHLPPHEAPSVFPGFERQLPRYLSQS